MIFVFLTSLNIITSRSIRVAANGIISFFLQLTRIPLYKYIYNGIGNGNPRQYACLENSLDRGAWLAAVHGVAKSRTQLRD